MPFLHRIACFRDDIIFFIFLYQVIALATAGRQLDRHCVFSFVGTHGFWAFLFGTCSAVSIRRIPKGRSISPQALSLVLSYLSVVSECVGKKLVAFSKVRIRAN